MAATITPARTLALRFLKTFVWGGGILLIPLSSLYFFPGLALLAGKVKDTSPYCTMGKAMSDVQLKLHQEQHSKALRAESKKLKTENGLDLWQTPQGNWWLPSGSDEILFVLLAQQDRNIYGTAGDGGVKPGDVVLDCGARIGTYARKALNAGASKVIAIEPSPDAVESMRRNMAAEIASGKVVIVPKGVWDKEETLVFYSNGNGAAGDSFVTKGEGAKEIRIPVTTIDLIAAELNLNKIDLVKADVKGASERMLHGSVKTIAANHPRFVISTEEEPEDPKALADFLSSQDSRYRARGGPCLYTGDAIRSDTMFFALN